MNNFSFCHIFKTHLPCGRKRLYEAKGNEIHFIFKPGYTLCWDNVGRQIKARHQTRNHGNQYLIWALAFLAKNRVNTTTYVDETTINAVDIATDAFMLTGDDVRLIRDKMIIVIGEVLAKNLKCLEPLKDVSRRRPKHMHSDESRQKSEIVSTCTSYKHDHTFYILFK